MIINPSNPCGSSFSKSHIIDIIKIADEFKLPIIADEVYYGLLYDPEEGEEFNSFGNMTKDVPIIVLFNFLLLIFFQYSVVEHFPNSTVSQDGDLAGLLFIITTTTLIK